MNIVVPIKIISSCNSNHMERSTEERKKIHRTENENKCDIYEDGHNDSFTKKHFIEKINRIQSYCGNCHSLQSLMMKDDFVCCSECKTKYEGILKHCKRCNQIITKRSVSARYIHDLQIIKLSEWHLLTYEHRIEETKRVLSRPEINIPIDLIDMINEYIHTDGER